MTRSSSPSPHRCLPYRRSDSISSRVVIVNAAQNHGSGEFKVGASAAHVYIALAAHALIAAGGYLFAKRALFELSAFEFAALRFAPTGLLFAGLLAAYRMPLFPPRAAIGRVLVVAIVGIPLNQGFFLLGIAHSTPTHASILYAMTPAAVLVIARIALREPISRARVGGIAVAFAGAVAVLLGGTLGVQASPVSASLAGDAVLVLGVVSWSSYTVLTRPLAQRYGAIQTTSWTFMLGAIITLPATPFALADTTRLANLSTGATLGVVYLIVSSVVGYLLWVYGLRSLAASRVAVFSNVQPVLTALLGTLLLGEDLAPLAAAGGLIVIAGVTLAQRR